MKSSEIVTAQEVTASVRIKDIAVLFKTRLAALVVFSSVLMYFLGASQVNWFHLFVLCIGGYLLTGASNGFNQVWEKDLDKLMDRTKDRPVPTGRLSVRSAMIVSGLAGAIGIFSMWFFINQTIGILSFLAFFSYVFLYTPLKQKSVAAVFVGAFPGAIPPLLGYVAATGSFSMEAGILFLMQFVWQFPHFWSIAWVADDDYAKADFRLLPTKNGRDKKSALVILISCILLIPAGFLPSLFPMQNPVTGLLTIIVASLLGIFVLYKGYLLYKNQDLKSAKGLMFSTFIYLPVLQIIYVLDKFI